MIHNSSSVAAGNKNDFRKAVAACESVDEGMALAYKTKCGHSTEELLTMMDNETWLNAEKAKELGLVDEIMGQNETEKEPEPDRLVASASGLTVDPGVMNVVNGLKMRLADANQEVKRLTELAKVNAFMAKFKEGL